MCIGLSFRRGWYSSVSEDPADRGCADPVTEPEQFALDPR